MVPDNKAEVKINLGIINPYLKRSELIQHAALIVIFPWINKFLWVRRRHMQIMQKILISSAASQ